MTSREMARMNNKSVFTRTSPELLPILEELRLREPIFHTLAFAASPAEYERATALEYWEVGASGRRYSRDFILRQLYTTQPPLADALGWQSWDHAVRRLGADTFLITYVLRQGDRLTRRATIWEHSPEGWRVLFHQGTVVAVEEDDTAPV
jgi:hypothetical protein